MLSDTKVIELTLYIVADMRWYAGRRPFAASCGFSEHQQQSWAFCNLPRRIHQGKCLHLQMTEIGWPCLLHSLEWFHICCAQAGWPASQIPSVQQCLIWIQLGQLQTIFCCPMYCNSYVLTKSRLHAVPISNCMTNCLSMHNSWGRQYNILSSVVILLLAC